MEINIDSEIQELGSVISLAEIENKVIGCVAESLMRDRDQINLATRIISDLNADSLDFMDIIFSLEAQFQITIDKNDFNLVSKLGLPEAEIQSEGVLSLEAKKRLRKYIPNLPLDNEIKAIDLGKYLSIHSVCQIVTEKLQVASL